MDFFKMVEQELIVEKYNSFLASFSYPIPTNALMEEIFEKIGRVFDGMNPVYFYDFDSQRESEDFERYRETDLKLSSWWKTEGLQAMKTRINSFVVVDVGAVQTTEKPEPYPYFIDLKNILHCSTIDGCQVEWVIFKVGDKIAVYDDEYYRVFESTTSNLIGNLIIESKHNLGYCPVRTFWTDSINAEQKIIKKHISTNWLYKLCRLLFYDIANESLNTYSRFPVTSAFSTDCNFENRDLGQFCQGGYLSLRTGGHVFLNGRPAACPVCSKKRFNGPGSHIEVAPPSMINDKADLRQPFQYANIPTDSLKYNNDDIIRRATEIFKAITGFQGMPINNKAVNEKQVVAVFESLEGALKVPQRNLENIIKWVDSTIARLRYNTFKGCSISLGTEHFLLSGSELISLYEAAQQSSFPADTLNLLQEKYFNTEYRNNPELKQRHLIIAHLDPFRHRTVEQVTAMYEAGQIRFLDFMLKVNLSSLLMRFESEVFPITAFSDEVKMSDKVKVIKDKMGEFIAEMMPETETNLITQ